MDPHSPTPQPPARSPLVAIETRDGEAVPVASGRIVADIISVLHERTIDDGLAALAIPELDRTTLEPLLTYCAERRCITDVASCPGCKRRPDSQQISTLDQFVAQHERIEIAEGTITLRGAGTGTRTFATLEDLARTWSGDEIWFFARRVLRKLRYGTRSKSEPRPAQPPSATRPQTHPAIILVEPQLADNVGMVARAMANFRLGELRLVAPRDGWPNERARIAASGATFVVDEAATHDSLTEAIADLNYVVATTARQRDLAKPVLTPEQAVAEMATRIARGERCGILFGRERNGLETGEVAHADAIIMVPVDPKFASLNLAQSVLVLAYEWMKQSGGGTLGRVTTYETPAESGLNRRGFAPATKEQLFGFFDHLEAELERMGFFGSNAKRPVMIQNLRTMFTRLGATEQEVRTLRGIVKALVHGKGAARRADDDNDGTKDPE